MSEGSRPKSSDPTPRGSMARRGRRIARYVLGVVTVILIIDAFVGEKGLLTLLKARRDFHAVEKALERSRQENAELRELARRLREEPSAIEEIARRELGLIKPGEKLFIIRDAQPKAAK